MLLSSARQQGNHVSYISRSVIIKSMHPIYSTIQQSNSPYITIIVPVPKIAIVPIDSIALIS